MSGAVMAALKKRCAAPAWAFLEEVRDKAGFDATRSADALAMSLWKSRGLELHGFEVKANRADWIRERDNPEKAEAISRFCDRWWLAVQSADIVLDGELPPSWGLLVLHGKALKTVREAEKRTPDPLPRTFLATMLKRATAAAATLVPREELSERIDAEVAQRLERGASDAERELKALRVRDEQLSKLTAALGIHNYDLSEHSLPNIAAAYEITSGRGLRADWYRRELENAKRAADVASEGAAKALADLERIDAIAREERAA